MLSYESMIKVNHALIKGEMLDDGQTRTIADQFLSRRILPNQAWECEMDAESQKKTGKRMYPIKKQGRGTPSIRLQKYSHTQQTKPADLSHPYVYPE